MLQNRQISRICRKKHKPVQFDGQVAWQWAYSAFGDEQPTIAKNRFANTALNQSFGSTNVAAVTFNLRYPGQYFDVESGLHYNWHRSYCTNCGRYTQADPIDLQGGWNRFGYVGGNPLSMTDPMGLQAVIVGPGGIPIPIPPTPGSPSPTSPPGWDPTDGPAPRPGGNIVWPPGFSPNPQPTQCQIDVPPPDRPIPPKPDCDSKLKVCMSFAKSGAIFATKAAMTAMCFVEYAVCKKWGQ